MASRNSEKKKDFLKHSVLQACTEYKKGVLAPNDATCDALRVVKTSTGHFSPLETRAVKNTAVVFSVLTLRTAAIQHETAARVFHIYA